jgi:hypothetical protein
MGPICQRERAGWLPRKNNTERPSACLASFAAGDSSRRRDVSLPLLPAAGLPQATVTQYSSRVGDSVTATVADA